MLEHDGEPSPGLPQELPRDERILWQGKPVFGSLVRHSFHVRKLAVYFLALLALRIAFQNAEGTGVAAAIAGSAGLVFLAAVASGVLMSYARLVASRTIYTITNRRIIIRCGVAVPLTLNLPYSRLAAADLRTHADGSGDISVLPERGSRVSYILLWPYVKPFRLLRVRPVLRGIADAGDVAELLRDALAAELATGKPTEPEVAGQSAPAPQRWRAYPTVPLTAAASLILFALVSVGLLRLSDAGTNPLPQEPPIAAIDLYFEDRDDGSVVVIDAEDGSIVTVLAPGSNGFLRSTMRTFVRARRAVDAGSETPFELRHTAGGRLLLQDPATGHEVDLWAFGETNAQAFGRFLYPETVEPVIEAVALTNQETRQ